MATYLGLDLGTTAAKGVILSDDGQVIVRARVPHRTVPGASPSRVRPETWATSIAAVCDQLGPGLPTVRAVGLATHCPSMVPLDATGRAVGAALCWDHPAMAEYLTALAPRRSPAMLAATGNHPAPSTCTALAYHYFHDHDRDAFAAMTWLGFVGTWLGALLTGSVAVDPTQASYSGVYDVTGPQGDWLPTSLSELDIDGEALPLTREALDVLGTTSTPGSRAIGLPDGIPVIVGSADTPAAAHALGYAPLLSLGTTHVVSGSRTTPDPRNLVLQRRGIRSRQWLVNGVLSGGTALAGAAQLAGHTGPDAVGDLVHDAGSDHHEPADAPVFIPHLTPERGPLWLDRPASGVLGLTASTTGSQFARALVDGVVFADRLVLEATLPVDDDPTFLTGSFGDDLSLPQRISDLTRRRLLTVTEPDLPAIGAAMMAAESTARVMAPFRPLTCLVEPRGSADATQAAWASFLHGWTAITGIDPATLASGATQPGHSHRSR